MIKALHVQYRLLLFDFKLNLNFLDRLSEKHINIDFHENPSSGSRLVAWGQTDRHTDMS